MATIPLTQGKVAIVDDGDFEWLSQWKWTAARRQNGKWHAYRQHRISPGVWRPLTLARQILGLAYGDPRWADHKNHDTLDDRRENLRIVTPKQNRENQPSRGGSSAFVGVTWDRDRGRWRAQIQIDGRVVNLGRYLTEREAADARDRYVIDHGSGHMLNRVRVKRQ